MLLPLSLTLRFCSKKHTSRQSYIKFNIFYILQFTFPHYSIKYANNFKCMSVSYIVTVSGTKMVEFNYKRVKMVLNYLALTYK